MQTHFEIERKFLVKFFPDSVNRAEKHEIVQAYSKVGNEVERVRSVDGVHFFKTIKKGHGLKRIETEFEISKKDYDAVLNKCAGKIIEKERFKISLEDNLVAEIDVYKNKFFNKKPLCVVEVEFPNVEKANSFQAPKWFGEEVTFDKRFENSVLAQTGENVTISK